MSGCQTCGGFGHRHDPIAHGFTVVPDDLGVEIDDDILDRWWLCKSGEFWDDLEEDA